MQNAERALQMQRPLHTLPETVSLPPQVSKARAASRACTALAFDAVEAGGRSRFGGRPDQQPTAPVARVGPGATIVPRTPS
jgi:hypothetical protein